MNIRKFLRSIGLYAFLAGSLLFAVSCNNDSAQKPGDVISEAGSQVIGKQISVEYAPKWTDLLHRDSGWVGADGIYSIPMDGIESQGRAGETETLLIFSDTIIGDIEEGSWSEDGWGLVHNSVAYLRANEAEVPDAEFHIRKDENGQPVSMFEPETPNAKPANIYWLGDGFVNTEMDNSIYIFAYRVESLDGGIYPFRIAGVSLIKLPADSRPPYEEQEQLETPLFRSKANGNITFGSSILVNTETAGAADPDGYVYVYGVKGLNKELVASRVKPEDFEDFSKWRFWNGSEWSADLNEIKGLIPNVSNEMSISAKKDEKFLATYQLNTNSPDIVIQVGNSPVGPFHPYKKIWKTPEIYKDLDFYTYNAKAHPHLSKQGELLITYNVNSFDFLQDIEEYPRHVRPRFIRLKY